MRLYTGGCVIMLVLVGLLTAEAQQPTTVYQVGWLTPGSRIGPNATLEVRSVLLKLRPTKTGEERGLRSDDL
jgi:hypothetical protein